MAVPENGIGMEVFRGVEPQHVPHLTVPSPVLVHIRLNQIWLPTPVPQELEI